MYVQHNIEALSYNSCCSGKAVSITQPVYVFVALGIQLTLRLRRRLWPAPLCNVLPHCRINGTIKKKLFDINVCLDFLYNFCPKYFSF
jgi:hypothetical protein